MAYGLEKKPFLGFQLFKQREGKEEEKKSRFGTLIFVSMELLYGILVRKVRICWLGNPPNSLFAYVWV